MKALPISARARKTPPSPIRKLAHLANKARESGARILPLNIGQPDIKTPAEFFEGVAAYREEVLAYEQSQGNASLINAWCRYMDRTLGLSLQPEQFLITTGASEALIFVFMILCDPGDEVLIFDPTYANYIGFAAVAGVTLVPVHTRLEDNFALPPVKEIRRHLTPKTRAVLLCNPNNPTGTVYSREELGAMLELCKEHRLFLVIDETYREFVYDGGTPLSVLHLDAGNPGVIVVDSLSKRFSLCGARLGALITANEQVLAAGLNLAQARLASPTLEQAAAAHMLERIPLSFLEGVRREYEGRRNTLVRALAAIKGVTAHVPRGAFYTVVRVPAANAEAFASYMLSEFRSKNRTIFVAPAAGFYMQPKKGLDELRLAYVIREPELAEAIGILGEGLDSWNAKER
jgi:aspartate aminotransferase